MLDDDVERNESKYRPEGGRIRRTEPSLGRTRWERIKEVYVVHGRGIDRGRSYSGVFMSDATFGLSYETGAVAGWTGSLVPLSIPPSATRCTPIKWHCYPTYRRRTAVHLSGWKELSSAFLLVRCGLG